MTRPEERYESRIGVGVKEVLSLVGLGMVSFPPLLRGVCKELKSGIFWRFLNGIHAVAVNSQESLLLSLGVS